MALDSTNARTLADVALAELREAIVSGELPPGSPVPVQPLADKLSMSSVPIREALRLLEQKGLIDRSPHRGVTVSQMSARDLEDTYTIRLELEGLAVRLATKNMTDVDRQAVNDTLARYTAAMRRDDPIARELHREIHLSLYRMARSKWLMLMIMMLWDNSERYRRLSLPRRGTAAQRIAEHRRLVQACCAGDAEAAEQALQTNLRNTYGAAVAELHRQELLASAPSGAGPRRRSTKAAGR